MHILHIFKIIFSDKKYNSFAQSQFWSTDVSFQSRETMSNDIMIVSRVLDGVHIYKVSLHEGVSSANY